ncbi:MAG: penicillin-binding protein 2 [Gammaproteobacteria bacterium]|nr:penicillin-binding protein 2 [Gammaproteobacteria bacterium]MYD79197.1 penicillin-binding protein 2 [Gammaproteobacteria bacterium]
MMRSRLRFAIMAFVVVALVMLARMFILATYDRDFLQEQGDRVAQRAESVPTTRGIIYDRAGQPLAISTPVQSIWTDPGIDSIPTESLPDLAQALQISEEQLRSTLREASNRRFVYLKKRVSHEVAEAVGQLGISGVRFSTEFRRYYPAGEVTAHVVGLIKNDGKGAEGLELSRDVELTGETGQRRVLRARDGRRLRDIRLEDAPKFGEDITTTIDLGLQYLAFRQLRQTVAEHDAKSATLVLIDVLNGEILSLASYPSYNPNDGGDRSFSRMRNRAVTDTYEPGSTIKTFAAIAALESSKYQPESEIDTSPGYFGIGRHLVEDPRNYGTLTLEGVLIKSSQVGISRVALSIDKYAVFSALNRAGVVDEPHSGLPYEANGHINIEDLERDIGRATMSYGYGLRVSPLQLAVGYLTIATGGIRRSIGIVREPAPFKSPDQRVFKEEHAKTVLQMLEGVVSPIGTAPKANLEGFSVAGKTGTVRKILDGSYDESRHIAWFVGIAPSTNPRIVCVVVVDEPMGETRSGGGVASPVFAEVARHALQLMGLTGTPKRLVAHGNAA